MYLAWLQFTGSYKVGSFHVGKGRSVVCIFKEVGLFLKKKKGKAFHYVGEASPMSVIAPNDVYVIG